MMMNLVQAIPFSFAALFPVVNPIGSSVIFMSLVNGATPQEVRSMSLKISVYAAILLITVLFLGSGILRLFGITIPVVLIGGGLVLAYIGWQLLNEPAEVPAHETVLSLPENKADAMAFYPLTMPVTTGPGCIAVAIALGAHSMTGDWNVTFFSLMGNAIGILLVSLSIFICYRYTYVIARRLGPAGTQVIMRLAAFLNLCIGLQLIVHGVRYLTS